MRVARAALATPIAILLASSPACAKALRILADHHVQLDNGPELDDVQFRVELKRMKRDGDCPDVRVLPDKAIPFRTVAAIMNEFVQLSGCARIGEAGEEYIPNK